MRKLILAYLNKRDKRKLDKAFAPLENKLNDAKEKLLLIAFLTK